MMSTCRWSTWNCHLLIILILLRQSTSFSLMPSSYTHTSPTAQFADHNRKINLHQSMQATDDAIAGLEKPSLVVFDLDNTLWTPELYQLRKLQRMNIDPVADKDVTLFPAAKKIIESVRSAPKKWSGTKFAVASRTKSVAWAHSLLKQFGLYDFFDYIEIFPGDKKQHFANLKEMSGVSYQDMIFFDDSRDGRFGNCEPVSQLGVLSVHTPNGLYEEDIWKTALTRYSSWSESKLPNTIVEWDGSITTNGQSTGNGGDTNKRFSGTIKTVNEEKRYGFIKYGGKDTKDMFFHFNDLPGNTEFSVKRGDTISFTILRDPKKGKNMAKQIQIDNASKVDTVEMRVFSMNLPFAALLANEYKTLETRNGTMFTPYPEGTKMLLHVGQRIYPDGDRHIDVMKSGGLNDEEIQRLKALPNGFSKGQAVAIVELGRTFETTLAQRSKPDFQRSVGAFGEDSGMRATEIKRVQYLKKGVIVSGRGGVFKAMVPRDVIPDGWLD